MTNERRLELEGWVPGEHITKEEVIELMKETIADSFIAEHRRDQLIKEVGGIDEYNKLLKV